MYRTVSTLAAAAVAFLGTVAAATQSLAGERYTFGVVPQFEARKLAEVWTPILEELEARTGYEFVMEGSPRIPEFEVAFKRGAFDFAYMNPYHAQMAESSQGYQLLVRDSARKLSGILVVAKDGPVKSIADLEGATIAFPAPNALGASLMIRADLTETYGVTFVADYVSTHSSAYLNVALGEAAAAGGVMSTFNLLESDIRERLEIIHQTPEVAPHPVVAHPRVPVEVSEAVRKAFIEMGATDAGRTLLKGVPMTEPVAAAREDYQPLLALHLDRYVISGSGL